MKTRVQSGHLTLLRAGIQHEKVREGDGEAALPAAILLLIALIRLAAFAWHPVSWGMEESIALAFALVAGFLLSQSVPRSKGGSEGSVA